MVNQKNVNKKNWTNRDYHVQHNKYVEHQDMKMYCDTNQFSELHFLGTHNKPHGVHVLVKHYHMYFFTKLLHVTHEIFRIPSACNLCTSIIENSGSRVCHHRNNLAINPSNILHTVLC